MPSLTCEFRHFHTVVVQKWQRNVQKGCSECCCFADKTYCFFDVLDPVAVIRQYYSNKAPRLFLHVLISTCILQKKIYRKWSEGKQKLLQVLNTSSMRHSVSSPDETLRKELKICCTAEYFLMWLNVISARLNTRQCWPAFSTTNHMWSGLRV